MRKLKYVKLFENFNDSDMTKFKDQFPEEKFKKVYDYISNGKLTGEPKELILDNNIIDFSKTTTKIAFFTMWFFDKFANNPDYLSEDKIKKIIESINYLKMNKKINDTMAKISEKMFERFKYVVNISKENFNSVVGTSNIYIYNVEKLEVLLKKIVIYINEKLINIGKSFYDYIQTIDLNDTISRKDLRDNFNYDKIFGTIMGTMSINKSHLIGKNKDQLFNIFLSYGTKGMPRVLSVSEPKK
jgi:hypothetical protein